MVRAEITVIGLGPAGCLFLACLPPEKLNSSVVAIDRGCIGGDLARLYGNVVANLTRTEIETAFQKVPAWSSLQEFPYFTKYAATECPLLSDVCLQLRECMQPILAKITVRFAEVEGLRKEEDGWSICLRKETLQTQKVILCTGATPTQLDLPKSIIPLEIALSNDDLAHFIHPSHHIVVFGSSHSGTLVMRNLKNSGCKRITCLYKDTVPFRWARDGDTEGLKQESAIIADEITAGSWCDATPQLIPVQQTGAMLRALLSADYVVYAMGFEARYPSVDGALLSHNSETAALAPGMWGFGIGFPSFYKTPGGTIAPDVGFGQFAGHILSCMSAILSA